MIDLYLIATTPQDITAHLLHTKLPTESYYKSTYLTYIKAQGKGKAIPVTGHEGQ
jgi:hypothetical protein